jgi:hypothetical protein
MATGTAGDTGQRYHTNQEHYLIKRVSYADWSGTNNDRKTVGVLPPRAIVTGGSTWIITGFNDTTGDDLDIGVSGTDDDLFASGVDVNTGTTLTAFDDLADANRYTATARTVTVNFTTAPTGDGTAGEAIIYLTYVIAPSVS